MPKPKPDESKQDYLKRCVQYLIENEDMEPDQAYAVCNIYWKEEKKLKSPLVLTYPLKLESVSNIEENNSERNFYITAYTGDVVDLGYMGKYIFDLNNIKYNQKIPIFREHDPEKIIGYSTKIWVSDNTLLLTGKFVSTEEADEVYKLLQEGFPFQASIGIWPVKIKYLPENEETEINGKTITGPVEIWTESQLKEVSICALGADSATATIALSEKLLLSEEGNPLEEVIKELDSEIIESAISGERNRVLKILEASSDNLSLAIELINSGTQIEDALFRIIQEKEKFRKSILQELELNAPKPVTVNNAEEKPTLSEAEYELCKKLNISTDLYLKTKQEVR